jgi:hypothetical protein
MTQFLPDACVAVRPFAHQHEGETVTIGDLGRRVFLTIPAAARSSLNTVDLLTLGALSFGLQAGGLIVWIVGLHRARTQRSSR